MFFFFFKQKTAYEMRISDWSSDVCSSDLRACNVAPVKRRNRVVIMHREQGASGKRRRRALPQPDAVGIGDALVGEGADAGQRAAIEHLKHRALGKLVGGNPIAAAIGTGP